MVNHRIVDTLETGSEDWATVHVAAVVVEVVPHMAKHVVTLCGVAYHEGDSWVRGRAGVESISCQGCRANARTIGWLE